MKSTAIKGLPAINVLSGSKVGDVNRAWLDPKERRVVGFSIDAAGGFLQPERSLMADTLEIQALGDAALTLLNDAPQGAETSSRYDDLIDLNALHGREVFTDSGQFLGHVASSTFDPHTFTLLDVEVSHGSFSRDHAVPVAQVVTIGPEVIVVLGAVATDAGATTSRSSEIVR